MSNTEDRIPVPTNGHHRLPSESEALASPDSAAATVREPADEGLDAPSPTDPIDEATDAPRIVVTPGQATAVGFGILAGLALLVLGRRRSRNG
jgi:hypothetical protein